MFQHWDALAFLHWEMEFAAVQATLPPGLTVDTFEGRAYVGVVPFYMNKIRPRGLPCVPWLSHFLELNVRTYVHDSAGVPGVWFYSLDCNQPAAVWLARTFFNLPYHHATMHAPQRSGQIEYCSQRKDGTAHVRCDYSMDHTTRLAEPGTLDFWLIERYLLYSKHAGRLYRGQVHHEPYPLAELSLKNYDFRALTPPGLASFSGEPAHRIASPGVRVEVFGLERVCK